MPTGPANTFRPKHSGNLQGAGAMAAVIPGETEPAHWSRPRGLHQMDPVLSFSEDVSPFGVYDTAGNVLEWTKDWYDSKYYRLLAKGTTDNPTAEARQCLIAFSRSSSRAARKPGP